MEWAINHETMNPEKPKKSVPKKGRKRKSQETSQFCRICYRAFTISYGNFPTSKTGYISTENIFMVLQIEERIDQAFIIIPWRPRLSFRLGWTVFKPCLFPLRYESKSCSGYCWSFEELESARSMYRCPEWKVQTNVKLAAPGTTKQNSSKFKLSEQIWSKEIATRGSLGGVRNESVDPEELRSSEGICRSLGCEE